MIVAALDAVVVDRERDGDAEAMVDPATIPPEGRCRAPATGQRRVRPM
jgi:hypothetical protein